MYGETLPSWFWIIYWLFILTTLGVAVRLLIQRKTRLFSALIIFLVITLHIVGLLNSLPRPGGVNEFEHILNMLKQGAIWAIYVAAGYICLYGGQYLHLKK